MSDKQLENKVEVFDGSFFAKADKPSYREIKDEHGRIIDYQDVRVEGYANTFNLDRGGDQVIPGAFMQHLSEFLTNPVLLIDHVRESGFAAGVVKTAYEDANGLKVSAVLSNSPSEKMRDIRFKVAEGVLKTFSIGGKFFGKMVNVTPEDSRFMINKIELREISIVTVPMNKESLFEVKEESKEACGCGCGPKAQAEEESIDLVDNNGDTLANITVPKEGKS